jgi:hypothetical protein
MSTHAFISMKFILLKTDLFYDDQRTMGNGSLRKQLLHFLATEALETEFE